MTDYFSLLGQPRRPWLEADALKKRFLELSTKMHPDRAHTAEPSERLKAEHDFAELNQAYNQLRRPKERLQHLIELETGVKPQQVQQIPADPMDFFMQTGKLFKETDALLTEKIAGVSPLLQVQLFEAGQLLTDKLNELQRELNRRQEKLADELKSIDTSWNQSRSDSEARASELRRLEELYRLFSYYTKWEAQVQEKIVQLAL